MSWRPARGRGQLPYRNGSRLKEVTIDSLEAIGLPSRGENSLLDLERQKNYYAQILDRYKRLQKANDLEEKSSESTSLPNSQHDAGGKGANRDEKKDLPSEDPEPTLQVVKDKYRSELAIIITAMRKLRESIIASRCTDSFALSSYAFIIRATILVGSMEAYHPALLHLVRYILPANASVPGSSEMRHEFIGYLILDLVSRQDDLEEAHHVRSKSNYQDEVVNGLLTAITRGDWYSYWQFWDRLDKYQRQLCVKVDERIRARALDCLEASYRPEVPKSYVEVVAGRKFSMEELRKVKPNWDVKEDGFVIVRRRKNG